MDATVVRADGTVVVSIDGATLDLGEARPGLRPGPAQVAVRPESVRLAAADEAAPGPVGTVVKRSYVGSATEYRVTYGGNELFVVIPAGSPTFAAGAAVRLVIEPIGVAVFAQAG